VTEIGPDLLPLFLTRNLYRQHYVVPWPTSEIERVEKIKNDLSTSFGFSERGFSHVLSKSQIGLVYQCLQENLPTPTMEVRSRDVVMPARRIIRAVQFTEKILLDQGPTLIDFAHCPRDDRWNFLIDALRHRLEIPSFRDLPQAASPTQTNALVVLGSGRRKKNMQ